MMMMMISEFSQELSNSFMYTKHNSADTNCEGSPFLKRWILFRLCFFLKRVSRLTSCNFGYRILTNDLKVVIQTCGLICHNLGRTWAPYDDELNRLKCFSQKNIKNIWDYWVFELCPLSWMLNNTMFQKLALFTSSGEGVEETYSAGSIRKS
jgi:hypothetical protein